MRMTEAKDSENESSGNAQTLQGLAAIGMSPLARKAIEALAVTEPITPDRMAMAIRVLDAVEHALMFDDDHSWERLQRAHDAWYDVDEGIQGRRRAVVATIERWVNSAATLEPAWRTSTMLSDRLHSLARALVAIEPAFGDATAELLRSQMERAAHVARTGKERGRNNIGKFSVAAALSVACGAFGDDNTKTAAKAFRKAFEKKTPTRGLFLTSASAHLLPRAEQSCRTGRKKR